MSSEQLSHIVVSNPVTSSDPSTDMMSVISFCVQRPLLLIFYYICHFYDSFFSYLFYLVSTFSIPSLLTIKCTSFSPQEGGMMGCGSATLSYPKRSSGAQMPLLRPSRAMDLDELCNFDKKSVLYFKQFMNIDLKRKNITIEVGCEQLKSELLRIDTSGVRHKL